MIGIRSFLKSFLSPKRCLFDLLIICMVLSSIPAYALDKYDDDMTTTTGWKTTGTNNGTVTAVTWEGASAVELKVTTAGSSRLAIAYRQLPVSGTLVKIEATVDPHNVGTIASNNQFFIIWYSGSYLMAAVIDSGGFYVWNSSGTPIEVGTDISDIGTKHKWTLLVRNGNTSSATVDVYRDDILQQSGVSCNYASTSFANTIYFQQRGYTLNNATTYVDSLSVSSYGIQYFENCDDITDWTDADTGTTSESTQATFGDRSTAKQTVATAGAGKYARIYNAVASLPAKFIVEMSAYFDLIGTTPNNSFWFYVTRTPLLFHGLQFGSDGLFAWNGLSTYTELGTNIVDQDVWTSWRMFFDTSSDTSLVYVWKNGVYQGSIDAGFSTTGQAAGIFNLRLDGVNTSGVTTYVDYLRIYSEDGQLIQTVIE